METTEAEVDPVDPYMMLVTRKKFGSDVQYSIYKPAVLGCLTADNPLRAFFIRFIVTSSFFDYFILLTILVNCVFLGISNSPEEAEYVFTAIYTVEMLGKICGMGFAFNKGAYLRDGWNWLDFVVVILGYLTLLPSLDNYSAIRTFRVLRALRTISALPSLRVMVNSFVRSVRALGSVMVLVAFSLTAFAIIGVQLYNGTLLHKCVDHDVVNGSLYHAYNATFKQLKANESSWYFYDGEPMICGNDSSARHCPADYICLPDVGNNPNFGYTSFDHFGDGFINAFQLLTLDFWEDLYAKVLAANGASALVYFIIVIFFGSLFVINLVLAVVALSYAEEAFERRMEQKEEEERRLSQQQDANNFFAGVAESEEQLNELRRLSSTSFRVGNRCWYRFRRFLEEVADSSFFSGTITAVIVLNTLTLALYYPAMSETMENVLEILNYIWTACFIAEFLVKVTGYGPKKYFTNAWNVFDFIIVVLSVLEIILEQTISSSTGGLSVFRAFRLLRVLKLAQSWTTMRTLVAIIGNSLGALSNLTLILLIIIYIFAVMGMQLFGEQYKPDKFPDGEVPRWNFQDFGHSFLVIFRVLCGEWIEPSWDTRLAAGNAAVAFYFCVVLLGNFLVLNLFLALLLSAFDVENLAKQEEEKQQRAAKKKERVVERTISMLAKARNAFRRPQRVSPILGERGKEGTGRDSPSTSSIPPDDIEALGDALTETSFPDYGFDSDDSGAHTDQGQTTSEQHSGSDSSSTDKMGRDGQPLQVSTISALSNARLPPISPATVLADDEDGKQNLGLQEEDEDKLRTLPKFDRPKPGGSSRRLALSGADQLGSSTDTEVQVGRSVGLDQTQADESLLENEKSKPWEHAPISGPMLAFRRRVYFFITNWWFETFILVMIVWSSVMLAFEDTSLPTKPKLEEILNIFSLVFLVVFWIEAILKMIPHGPVAYFRSAWNWLDFIIVIISTIDAAAADSDISFLRVVRTLRALRPLRAVSRWGSMKVVVDALFMSVPSIGNVLLVCLLFWLIFSILGVQFFGGKFYRCLDQEGNVLPDTVVDNKTECLVLAQQGLNYTWSNTKINFDNTAHGFVALFQVATFEGWMEVIESATDARGIDKQPSREHAFEANFYFVFFIIFGAFFTLNLFVGVIIDSFNQNKAKGKGLFLTEGQKTFLKTVQNMTRTKPQIAPSRPSSSLRAFFYDIDFSKWFEPLILSLIIVNMIFLALEHYNQSDTWDVVLFWANIFFTAVFLIEAIIKLLAEGLLYFYSGWNVFDFVIVVLSIVGVAFDVAATSLPINPTIIRVLRVLRVVRMLRMVKRARGIKRLLVTLIMSGPALVNIATLLLLVMFIFSVMAMALFGNVKYNGVIDNFMNFETFARSLIFMFRIATAAGWNDVVEACSIQPPDCDPNYNDLPNGNCGDPVAAQLFFTVYVLITFLIMINMYIAIILENLTEAYEADRATLSDEVFTKFYELWAVYDPRATQLLSQDRILAFISEVPEPLGIPGASDNHLIKLAIPLSPGTHEDDPPRAHCADILYALVRHFLTERRKASAANRWARNRIDPDEIEAIEHVLNQSLAVAFPKRKRLKPSTSTRQLVEEQRRRIRAIMIIQRRFREFRRNRQQQGKTGVVSQLAPVRQVSPRQQRRAAVDKQEQDGEQSF